MKKNCLNCHNSFNSNGNKNYCYGVKLKNCKNCGEAFEYICGKRPRLTCGFRCSKLKNIDVRVTKDCLNCGVEFLGVHNQLYCNLNYSRECLLCGEIFIVKCDGRIKEDNFKYCDRICLNLSGGVIGEDKISEYKNVNGWALEFSLIYGRRPTINDFNNYFIVRNIPNTADFNLFHLSNGGSFLEEWFYGELKTIYGGEILRNKRPIVGLDNSKLELDFWLPDLGVAFEVNDLTAHSINGEFSINKYNNYRHGPFYHLYKVVRASEQLGVELFHVWEGDILLGYSFNIIYKILKEHVG